MEFTPLLLFVISTLADSNTATNTSTIEQIIEQAIHTFTTPQDGIQFQANLDDLSQRVNRLTLSDVSASQDSREDRYPVSYVRAYEDSHLTIGMFILKPNSIIPLHNHPLMHGILKVLRGSVRLQSYSHYPNNRIKRKNESKICLPSEQYFLEESCSSSSCSDAMTDDDVFVVCKNAPIILEDTSDCCVLTPVMNNLHEIRAHNGAAIFFDILAPPYLSMATRIGPRKCTYFEEHSSGVTRVDALDTFLSTSESGNAGDQCENVITLRVFHGRPIFHV